MANTKSKGSNKSTSGTLLTVNQQKLVAQSYDVLIGAKNNVDAAIAKAREMWRVIFPSVAHIRQVERYRAVLKGLKRGEPDSYAAQQFRAWVKEKNDGKIPGRKSGTGKGLTLARFANAVKERRESLANAVKQGKKLLPEALAKRLAKLAADFATLQEEIAAFNEEDAEAREAEAARKAA